MRSQIPCNRQSSKNANLTTFTAIDLDSWLEVNTVRCERLGSRVEPKFCKIYRKDRIACHGCRQAAEMDRIAEELEMARIDTCLECKRPDMAIVGRGLCGKCYHKFKKAGTLDENYPPVGGHKQKTNSTVDTPTKTKPAPAAKPVKQPKQSRDFADMFRPNPIEEGESTVVPLHFTARDHDLLSFLETWATDERRTLDQQILAVLDNAKTAAA